MRRLVRQVVTIFREKVIYTPLRTFCLLEVYEVRGGVADIPTFCYVATAILGIHLYADVYSRITCFAVYSSRVVPY